jgi:HD-GYP domain-containing protein (c-di-GMP phosphodiesterase class II)
MQSSAAFFGGAVLGGILAAACGFDLFPGEGIDPTAVSLRERELDEELRRQQESFAQMQQGLAWSQEQADRLQSKLASAHRAKTRSQQAVASAQALDRVQAKAHHEEVARLRGDLAGANERLARAATEVRKTQEQLHRQLVRFFARGRDAFDAVLVSEYLASEPSRDEQQEVVLQLIKWNKDVLQALPHDPARVEWPPGTRGAAVGVTARQEEASITTAGSGARATSGDSGRTP